MEEQSSNISATPTEIKKSRKLSLWWLVVLGTLILILGSLWFEFGEKVTQKLNRDQDSTTTSKIICPIAGGCDSVAVGFGETIPGEQNEVNPEETLIKGYEDSSYKVIGLVPNPFAEFANSEVLYVVATRGVNDSGCGGRYDSGACYFFLESDYYNGPVAKYVGSWGGGFAGVSRTSFEFKNNNMVVFQAGSSDAGTTVSEVWELDVRTGSTTRISQEVTESH